MSMKTLCQNVKSSWALMLHIDTIDQLIIFLNSHHTIRREKFNSQGLQCFHCKVKSQNWSSYHSVVNKTNSSFSHTEPYSSINQFNKTTHWCVPKPKRLETVFHDVVLSLSVCTVSTVKATEPHSVKATEPHSHWFKKIKIKLRSIQSKLSTHFTHSSTEHYAFQY